MNTAPDIRDTPLLELHLDPEEYDIFTVGYPLHSAAGWTLYGTIDTEARLDSLLLLRDDVPRKTVTESPYLSFCAEAARSHSPERFDPQRLTARLSELLAGPLAGGGEPLHACLAEAQENAHLISFTLDDGMNERGIVTQLRPRSVALRLLDGDDMSLTDWSCRYGIAHIRSLVVADVQNQLFELYLASDAPRRKINGSLLRRGRSL
ncbi:hypothetical protein ACUH95_00640 [Dermabacteraceae bacterium P13101]